jgi:hypothetical protein
LNQLSISLNVWSVHIGSDPKIGPIELQAEIFDRSPNSLQVADESQLSILAKP